MAFLHLHFTPPHLALMGNIGLVFVLFVFLFSPYFILSTVAPQYYGFIHEELIQFLQSASSAKPGYESLGQEPSPWEVQDMQFIKCPQSSSSHLVRKVGC